MYLKKFFEVVKCRWQNILEQKVEYHPCVRMKKKQTCIGENNDLTLTLEVLELEKEKRDENKIQWIKSTM